MSMMIPRYRRNEIAENNGLWGDRFFRSFFDMGDMFGSSSFRVDVKEKPQHYELEAEIPGVPKDQIEITAENGILTIAANMNLEKKEEKEDYIYSERRMGRFQRSFNLEGIRENGIKAEYSNGVLRLELPKEERKAIENKRKIEIS